MFIQHSRFISHPILNLFNHSRLIRNTQLNHKWIQITSIRNFATTAQFSRDVDYYKVLGIKSSATKAEIKKVYYALAKKHHPDAVKGKSRANEDKFKRITEAYNVLSNEQIKKQYDDARKENFYSGQTTGMGGHGQQFYGDRENTYTYSAKN